MAAQSRLGRLPMASRPERRLAAILAADVAGYSRLMGVDEEGTLATLTTHRRTSIHRSKGVPKTL